MIRLRERTLSFSCRTGRLFSREWRDGCRQVRQCCRSRVGKHSCGGGRLGLALCARLDAVGCACKNDSQRLHVTLILTVANPRGVYQSSDYQLTDVDTGAPVSDRAGSKQLVASFKGLHLILAFTGVATWRVGSRTERTVDWLSAKLKALPPESNLRAICRALAKKVEKCCGSRGELTLVLSVASVGKPFQTATISNVVWERKRKRLNRYFHIQMRTVQKPFHLISGGGRDCVSGRERVRLKALARKMDVTPKEVMTALTEINSIAADNSNGCVSKECWATAQFADGDDRRSQALNVGNQAGLISQLLGGMDMMDWMKTNLTAPPGAEIGLVQSAGLTSGPGSGIPITGPKGEPRTFLISTPAKYLRLRIIAFGRLGFSATTMNL